MIAAALTLLQWIGAIVPTFAVCVGAAGVYAAFHPFIRERRDREEELEARAERLENALILLYGQMADPKRGILATPGMADQLKAVQERQLYMERVIGVNGNPPRRSLLSMMEDADRERHDLKVALEDLRKWLERNNQR